MAEPTKELFKFAFFLDFGKSIDFLAKLASPEKWGLSLKIWGN